jgi:hypothetical protein
LVFAACDRDDDFTLITTQSVFRRKADRSTKSARHLVSLIV